MFLYVSKSAAFRALQACSQCDYILGEVVPLVRMCTGHTILFGRHRSARFRAQI